MASEEYGVKLKVTADTAEAQQMMDELIQQNQKRVQQSVSPSDGGGASGGINPKNAGKKLGQAFNQEVSGKSGTAIGKAIAGFILHQGLGAVLSSQRVVGGDNRNVDRAQAGFGGAMQFGTIGAMLGGPAGAVIGALLGGMTGLFSQYGKERQERQAAFLSRVESQRGAKEGALGSIGSMAASNLVDWQGDRESRIAWMSDYRNKIGNQLFEARFKTSNFNGDVNSTEYKHLAENEQRLQGLYYKSMNEEMDMRMDRLYDPFSGAEFTDNFSKRGLSVGAQVDVGSVNQKIVDQQQQMVDCLEKLVDLAIAGNYGGDREGNLEKALNILTALR